MSSGRRFGARALLSLLAGGLAVMAVLGGEAPPPEPLNVVLVSIDTLRADHLGAYGYGRRTSPRIDAFSREAILFEQAIAAAPSTLRSHASMLTALVAPHHGASIARKAALSPRHTTLAEVLQARSYATACWNGGAQLDRVWGLDQGFDVYRSLPQSAPGDSPASGIDQPMDRLDTTVQAALGWIDGKKDARPFFLFLHSYEVHSPYTPDPSLRRRFPRYPTRLPDSISVGELWRLRQGEWSAEPGDLAHIVASYDAEILSVDAAFGRLLDGLRERDLVTRTLIVLTSDHGEEFGEHGTVGWHSHTLFDELLRVPLLVRLPGGAHGGRRVAAQVSGIDVSPTILDALGIRSPPTFQGRSLLGLPEETTPLSGPFVLSARDNRKENLIALRGGGWKWIRGGGIYDLRNDPGEVHDLRRTSRESRARHTAMRRRADRWRNARRPPVSSSVGPDRALEEQLRLLGYVE